MTPSYSFDPCVHYLGLLTNSVGMPRVEVSENLLSLWHLNYLLYLLVKISCIFNQNGMRHTRMYTLINTC